MLNYSAPGWKCSFKLNAQAFRCLVLVIHCINPHLCVTVLEHFALPKQQLFLKGPEKKKKYYQGCEEKKYIQGDAERKPVMPFHFLHVKWV